MVARQEEMRRKTAQYEAELRTKTEVAKAKAEAEGRIAQERQNHDLILDKVKLELIAAPIFLNVALTVQSVVIRPIV